MQVMQSDDNPLTTTTMRYTFMVLSERSWQLLSGLKFTTNLPLRMSCCNFDEFSYTAIIRSTFQFVQYYYYYYYNI